MFARVPRAQEITSSGLGAPRPSAPPLDCPRNRSRCCDRTRKDAGQRNLLRRGCPVQAGRGIPCECTATESETFLGPRVLSEKPACTQTSIASGRCVAGQPSRSFTKWHRRHWSRLRTATGFWIRIVESADAKADRKTATCVASHSRFTELRIRGGSEFELGQPSSRLPAGARPRPRCSQVFTQRASGLQRGRASRAQRLCGIPITFAKRCRCTLIFCRCESVCF